MLYVNYASIKKYINKGNKLLICTEKNQSATRGNYNHHKHHAGLPDLSTGPRGSYPDLPETGRDQLLCVLQTWESLDNGVG